jgi:Integrase core domain
VRRYEHPAPGCLVHLDIKKLGNIPQGGGHRVHGRQLGKHHSQADKAPVRRHSRHPRHGYGYLHAAVDDHSRLVYVEIHPDEQAATACGFWTRTRAWFAERGITVQRVLTDNGACYRSHLWRQLLQRQGVTPQANPAVPASHQRQGGAFQPHPAGRVGLRPTLPVRTSPPGGLARLAAPV